MEKSINFARRHVWKVGAVVWHEVNGQKYFLAFESIDRPQRGTQLVRGKMERGENILQSVLREIEEELGLEVEIEREFTLRSFTEGEYSDCQIYFSARLKNSLDPAHVWEHLDTCPDDTQKLIWKSYPVNGKYDFLSRGHDQVLLDWEKHFLK